MLNKKFWINLIIAGICLLIFLYGVIKYLDIYTNHGEKIEVPNVVGMQLDEAVEKYKSEGIKFKINDSIFSDHAEKGEIVLQDPIPHTDSTPSFIKSERPIYIVTVKKSKQMLVLPDVINNSKRIAMARLEHMFKVDFSYEPYKQCKDCVIKVKYQNKEIEAGKKLPKGAKLEVILGKGPGGLINIPNLIGLTINEANDKLGSSALTITSTGACIDCKTKEDTASAIIISQFPAFSAGALIQEGNEIVITLSSNKELAQPKDTAK